MANTYLTRTTGTGSRRKFTQSVWFKRSKLGVEQCLFAHNTSPNYNIEMKLRDDDTFNFYSYNNSSATVSFITNRKFRDTSAWYHIVVAVDTENSTAGDRIRAYVNGSGSDTSALCMGGGPGTAGGTATEEWTAATYSIKTVTTS